MHTDSKKHDTPIDANWVKSSNMDDEEPMQDEDALLPCPFCGGEAKQIEVEPQAFCIECTKCQTSSKVVYFLMEDGSMLLREAWNLRQAIDQKELRRVVDAWERLSEGAHSRRTVECWLHEDMAPAIDRIRNIIE